MYRSAHRPGEGVPKTKVYWVHHYAHRLSHPALMRAGEEFPECGICGDRVRFEETTTGLAPEAWPIEYYEDFRRHRGAETQQPYEDDLQAA